MNVMASLMSLILLLKLLAKSFPYAIRLKNIAALKQCLYDANRFIRPTQSLKERREGMMKGGLAKAFKSSTIKKKLGRGD